jgi:hypothetical protein
MIVVKIKLNKWFNKLMGKNMLGKIDILFLYIDNFYYFILFIIFYLLFFIFIYCYYYLNYD